MEKGFEFYKEKKIDFYNKFNTETVLIYGKHREVPPYVTILLPTRKRAKLLQVALKSAIEQIGFNDYQIIVVDNGGEPLSTETETSIMMKQYISDKVIYYRHQESVSFVMDNAVKLARSKWIVFLHDDDILSPYHLKIMTDICKMHKKIRYLSCPIRAFTDGEMNEDEIKLASFKYEVIKKKKSAICLGYYPGWLGALIDRESYINTGGMPTYSNNLADFCMTQKFHYRYGIHELQSNIPLYYYREWKGQVSSGGTAVWTELYKNEYKYFQYASRVLHPLTYAYWDRISAYRILNKAITMNRSSYRYNIEQNYLADIANMPKDSLYKTERYSKDIAKRVMYESICQKFWKEKIYKGEIIL